MSGILIIAEHRRGELRPVTLELVTAAQAARRAPSDKVTVALIADEPARFIPALGVAGVDEIVAVKVAAHDFEPDTYEAVVEALIEVRQPGLVLVPHSIDSFGYAAALAAKGRYGFATDVFRFEYQDDGLVATRGGYGQKVNVEVDFPGKDIVVLALRANMFKPPEGAASPAVVDFPARPVRSRVTCREFIEMTSWRSVAASARSRMSSSFASSPTRSAPRWVAHVRSRTRAGCLRTVRSGSRARRRALASCISRWGSRGRSNISPV
jgi:electron transfer flavoprotein alpha subunit